MYKKILYGSEARNKVLDGVNKIVDAVAVTLGPSGRNVLIANSVVVDYGVHSLPINVTKDGYRTTKSFDVNDEFEKVGVNLVKEAAQKTVDLAGDGTTSTCVLLRAIVQESMKMIEKGANPMELKKGIDAAVEAVVGQLKKVSTPISENVEKIRQVATVSANNDKEIGDLIAKAFEKIGSEGVINIDSGKGIETEIKIADGYKFERGWISPLFTNNKEKQVCEFENPYILLYDKKITHHSQVQRVLEAVMQNGRPLLIVCEDAEEEGLAFLAMNNVQQRIQVCVVKAPSFGEQRREEMEDLAVLTGGTFVSDIRGVEIKNAGIENLGVAKKVIVSKEETVIIGGQKDSVQLETLLNELRMNLAEAKTEEEKYPIEKRIARINGGVAVILVGAATETEMKEKLDRFDDAVRATKSAIAEGYVAGGGQFFSSFEDAASPTDTDYHKGYNALINALKMPLKQICSNAGTDFDWAYSAIKESKWEKGYNAKTGKIEDLVAAGIIDPAKVLRCSLQNAASSAGMILTTECVIADSVNF